MGGGIRQEGIWEERSGRAESVWEERSAREESGRKDPVGQNLGGEAARRKLRGKIWQDRIHEMNVR